MILIRKKISGQTVLMPEHNEDMSIFKHCIGNSDIEEQAFLDHYSNLLKAHCKCGYIIKNGE